MFLHRVRGTGSIGRDELTNEVDHFIAGPGSLSGHPVLNEESVAGEPKWASRWCSRTRWLFIRDVDCVPPEVTQLLFMAAEDVAMGTL